MLHVRLPLALKRRDCSHLGAAPWGGVPFPRRRAVPLVAPFAGRDQARRDDRARAMARRQKFIPPLTAARVEPTCEVTNGTARLRRRGRRSPIGDGVHGVVRLL